MKSQDSHPAVLGRERVVRNVLVSLVLVFLVVPMLVPLYWLVLTALRPNSTTNTLPLNLLPTNLTLENVIRQLSDAEGFLTYFRNSLITASASMILSIIVSVLAGYALSRLRFPGKMGLLLAVLASQMFPVMLVVISLYVLYNRLGLLNSYLGLTLAFTTLSLPFSIWMMRGFFDSVPIELEEAAFVDGTSRMGSMWHVLLPAVSPGLISVALFSFLNAWNNMLIALTLTSSPDKRTIPPGFLATYVGEYQYRWSDAMAGSMIVTLPIAIVFILLQRYFVQGMTAGAVKG
ncbi:MAG: carbohydrate ABC transporter permease [Arachnia sp.]